MILTMQVSPEEFADLKRGTTLTISDPLQNLRVQVCAASEGYSRVECEQIQVGTDLRKGKSLFLNVKMIPQIQSVPAEHVAGAV